MRRISNRRGVIIDDEVYSLVHLTKQNEYKGNIPRIIKRFIPNMAHPDIENLTTKILEESMAI